MPMTPGALIATNPLKGPGPSSAAGLTVTCNCAARGVPVKVPNTGVTVSQFPPSLVTVVAVNVVALELVVETFTDWDAGTLLPAGKPKLSDVGVVERGLVPPAELALRTTGTESSVAPELILRKPT